jgi:hypothetical protein
MAADLDIVAARGSDGPRGEHQQTREREEKAQPRPGIPAEEKRRPNHETIPTAVRVRRATTDP